jgi:hypothetical protein
MYIYINGEPYRGGATRAVDLALVAFLDAEISLFR